jgi:hypothetical protein
LQRDQEPLILRPDISMQSAAIISPCHRYRFALWRRWDCGPQVLFVLLNPSTADETLDDPTIRRCLKFAQSWGYASLAVGNLFALRSTSPAKLSACRDPVGPDNDRWLLRLHDESTLTIAAWGNHGRFLGRSLAAWSLLPGMQILELTRRGEPRHPLYARSNLVPLQRVPFREADAFLETVDSDCDSIPLLAGPLTCGEMPPLP